MSFPSQSLAVLVVIALLVSSVGCGEDATTESQPSANTIVKPDGSGDYPTIQEAIDAADSLDIIELAPGTFRGDGNRDLDFLGKAITIRSIDGNAAECVIDCEGEYYRQIRHRGFVFQSSEGGGSILENLTIFDGCMPVGGAILCEDSSPTIRNCVFTECVAILGGAIACETASPTIDGCSFNAPVALQSGGGINCESSSPIISNSVFDRCWCAVWSPNADSSLLPLSKRQDHIGGAAIYCHESDPVITGSVMFGSRDHVGMASRQAALSCWSSSPEIGKSIICQSEGAAVYADETSFPVLRCSDLHENDDGDWVGAIEDQAGTEGNISADPGFQDPLNGDFTLQPNSPCGADSASCGPMGIEPQGMDNADR